MNTPLNRIPVSVRQAVWPWDILVSPPAPPSVWRALRVQVVVLPCASAIFFWLGHAHFGFALLVLLALFVFLGVALPRAHRAVDRAFLRFGMWAGHILSYVLLVPFYYLCFVPGRLIMTCRGKDPLRRAFPAPGPTCWLSHPESRAAEPYRRQY